MTAYPYGSGSEWAGIHSPLQGYDENRVDGHLGNLHDVWMPTGDRSLRTPHMFEAEVEVHRSVQTRKPPSMSPRSISIPDNYGEVAHPPNYQAIKPLEIRSGQKSTTHPKNDNRVIRDSSSGGYEFPGRMSRGTEGVAFEGEVDQFIRRVSAAMSPSSEYLHRLSSSLSPPRGRVHYGDSTQVAEQSHPRPMSTGHSNQQYHHIRRISNTPGPTSTSNDGGDVPPLTLRVEAPSPKKTTVYAGGDVASIQGRPGQDIISQRRENREVLRSDVLSKSGPPGLLKIDNQDITFRAPSDQNKRMVMVEEDRWFDLVRQNQNKHSNYTQPKAYLSPSDVRVKNAEVGTLGQGPNPSVRQAPVSNSDVFENQYQLSHQVRLEPGVTAHRTGLSINHEESLLMRAPHPTRVSHVEHLSSSRQSPRGTTTHAGPTNNHCFTNRKLATFPTSSSGP